MQGFEFSRVFHPCETGQTKVREILKPCKNDGLETCLNIFLSDSCWFKLRLFSFFLLHFFPSNSLCCQTSPRKIFSLWAKNEFCKDLLWPLKFFFTRPNSNSTFFIHVISYQRFDVIMIPKSSFVEKEDLLFKFWVFLHCKNLWSRLKIGFFLHFCNDLANTCLTSSIQVKPPKNLCITQWYD